MRILTLLGPTASGKTELAIALAKHLDGAIISADSRQIFRGMDIGTGKDLDAYGAVPRYLLDIREAGEDYHVAAFQNDFLEALAHVRESGKVPILCGGSGLYIQAALAGLPFAAVPVDPDLRHTLDKLSDSELLARFQATPSAYSSRADTSTRKRLIRAIEIAVYLGSGNHSGAISGLLPGHAAAARGSLIFGIQLPLEERRARITSRLHRRLEAGLLDEVEGLLARGIPAEKLIHYGLEYKFTTRYLQGLLEYEVMVNRLNTAIHQYAKRQMTFFRKLEKAGFAIHWIDGTQTLERQLAQIIRVWETGHAGFTLPE